MRVLVTGAGGFIGKNLIAYLATNNIEVIAFSRSEIPIEGAMYQFIWGFGKPLPKFPSNVDCAIHLAHDFNGNAGASLTIASTVDLVRLLKGHGIKKHLFFSSYSACADTKSIYGITKYKLEQILKKINGIILIRPGLVVGDGGIYKKIITCAKFLRVVPLPNGGHGKVPTVSIEKLNEVILKLILTNKKIKELNLFNPRLTSLREIILQSSKKKIIIVSIPYICFFIFLGLFEILKIRMPIKLDNLSGFIANQNSTHKASKLNSL
jgi:nucleoside-diphosphate-sugar epimerase